MIWNPSSANYGTSTSSAVLQIKERDYSSILFARNSSSLFRVVFKSAHASLPGQLCVEYLAIEGTSLKWKGYTGEVTRVRVYAMD